MTTDLSALELVKHRCAAEGFDCEEVIEESGVNGIPDQHLGWSITAKGNLDRGSLHLMYDFQFEDLVKTSFERFHALPDYCAIWSPDDDLIECELSSTAPYLGGSEPFQTIQRRINGPGQQPAAAASILFPPGNHGPQVSLALASPELLARIPHQAD